MTKYKCFKITIFYEVLRVVEVIGPDNMTESEAIQDALKEDTVIRDDMRGEIKAVRWVLQNAASKHVESVEVIDVSRPAQNE